MLITRKAFSYFYFVLIKAFKTIFFLITFFLEAQETFIPFKTDSNQIILDGKLSQGEWDNATQIALDIEFSPANNLPSKKETIGYVTYSNSFLFVGVYAKDDPKNIRAAIRQRDGNIWNDDLFILRLDPYKDARNNIGIVVNALGSQFDFKEINLIFLLNF